MGLGLRGAAAVLFGTALILIPARDASASPEQPAAARSSDTSAQARRGPTRLRVTPLPGKLERECVPVFQERWIPQWGGWVLRAGQSCRWVRVPY